MPLIEPVAKCRKFNVLNGNLGAQLFYLQLKTVTDPLGRHDAHPAILNSTLFPLNKAIRDTDISRWLLDCEHAGLLRCYGDSQGALVVQVFDAIQRLAPKNMKSKHAPPEGQQPLFTEASPHRKRNGSEVKRSEGARACQAGEERTLNSELPSAELPARCRQHVGSVSSGDETAEDGALEHQRPTGEVESSVPGPTLAMVLECAARVCVPLESARKFHEHYEGNRLWFNKFNRLINWQFKLKSWGEEDRAGKYEKHASAGGKRHDRNAGTANAGRSSQYAGLKQKP